MRKIFLFVCTFLCCLSGFASVTLFPSTTSITAPSGGGSVGITVLASGESNTGTITNVNYGHNVTASPVSSQFDAYPISGVTYHSPAGGPPTYFPFNISISGSLTQAYNVTYHILTTVYNSVSGSSTSQDLTFVITINPYTPPPPPTYWNVAKSGSFTRSNCTGGQTGSTVTYTIAAHSFSSTVSQADADQQAVNNVNTTGPYYANTNGTCAYWNVAESGTFTRNNCTAGQSGSNYTYTVAAHTYSSTTSQAAANQLAINDVNANGQNVTNTNGYGSCGACVVPTKVGNATVDGAPYNGTVTTGGSSHFLSIIINTPPLPLANYSFTTSSATGLAQDIHFDTDPDSKAIVDNHDGTSTITQEFYFAPTDSSQGTNPFPINLTVTNTCGAVSSNIVYTFHI